MLQVARELIGKKICTKINGRHTSGMIVEVEAYSGAIDKASHAFPNKVTKRTQSMFKEGGISYVYLCYGIHVMFNIVTNINGNADAVLLRAIEPTEGVDIMEERRGIFTSGSKLTSGPAKLAKALGIKIEHNETDLNQEKIWLEDYKSFGDAEITATTRVGVDYAGEDAKLPWRFYLNDNNYVSKS